MECIVVGAGAAGLMASSLLLEHDVQVTVIEARQRVGGRICTVVPSGFSSTIDAGAEFIHGESPIAKRILTDAGSRWTHLRGEQYQLKRGVRTQGQLVDEDWPLLLAEIKQMKNDMPFAEFLQQKFPDQKFQSLRENAIAFVEGYNLAAADRASTLALKEEWLALDTDDQSRPDGGYMAMVNFLQQKVVSKNGTLRLGEIVKEIQWRPGRVGVTTTSGSRYNAEKVLITIPVGPLQRGMIAFDPPLFAHERAFRDIGFGGVLKYHVELGDKLRGLLDNSMPNLSFLLSDASVPTWWSKVPGGPQLVGWLGGPAASVASAEGTLMEKFLESLSYVMAMPIAEVVKGIRAYHIADWSRDPYACGGYSFSTLKTPGARATLTTPVQSTLYFAGEALTTKASPGTVEAALKSGTEAAAKILSVATQHLTPYAGHGPLTH